MPPPRTPCWTCKQRRLTCDSQRPSCSRCLKAGRNCLGYSPVKPVRFLAPGQVVSRKAPRASATTPTRTYAVEEPKDDKDSGNKADLTVRKVPVLHDRCEAREIKALAFLLDHMSISMETRNVLQRYMYNPGHPRGKPDAREDLMAMSLHALAYGASWRIGQFVDDRRLAWQHYITALSKADAMISDPALALSDEVILSVKAFELYELLCGDDLNLFGVGLHILGSVALVRHRGRKNFETLHATLVFHSVRMVLISTCLHFSLSMPPYQDDMAWADAGTVCNDDPIPELVRIADRLTKLRADTRDAFLCGNEPQSPHVIEKYLSRAIAIDRELIGWFNALPQRWCPRKLDVPSFDEEVSKPPGKRKSWTRHAYVFPNATVAAYWPLYWLLRIYAIAGTYRLLSYAHHFREPSSLQDQCRELLQVAVDETCACCAAAIEDLGGELANSAIKPSIARIWSILGNLAATSCVETVSSEQRQWVRGRMSVISGRFGPTAANHMLWRQKSLIGQTAVEPEYEVLRGIMSKGFES